MNVKKVLFVGFALLCMKTYAQKNNYTNGIGLRLSGKAGITYKYFLNSANVLEAATYFGNGITVLNATYQHHMQIKDAKGLQWYYGGGANLVTAANAGLNLGIVGVIGLDFKLENLPINLSLDYQPYFGFGNVNGFGKDFLGGLAIRYTF